MLSPQEFVAKWKKTTLTERASVQSHFNDLCVLLGQPTPTDADPTGEWYTFEKGLTKSNAKASQGFADVWKRGYFAWEYKGKEKGKSLKQAYEQLQLYREALENPPVLVVSDISTIQIHTNFTNTVKQIYELSLDDLLDPKKLDLLRQVFTNPEALRKPTTTAQVTEQAAREFAKLAEILRKQPGVEPTRAAHFLIRVLFCLFAEDIGLLPPALFTKLVERTYQRPLGMFVEQLRQLFDAMRSGGMYALEYIPCFNGGLFDNDDVIQLPNEAMEILIRVGKLDWSNIEPAILGTLFERSLDPGKRSQLGAHYTSREDILLIVEPVLMAPLRRRWQTVEGTAREIAARRDTAGTGNSSNPSQRTKFEKELVATLMGFADEIAAVRVLDPACGSGNFLYVALKQLLDLQKEVVVVAGELGLSRFFPTVGPGQLHGIEINEYAHELAQITIWIGYIQWLRDNGFGQPDEPILKPIKSILNMDAVLAYDEQGKPVEPVWPVADVVIGNPPFLGDKRMRLELGDKYVEDLRKFYEKRIPGQSDFVCYWFERTRELIELKTLDRAGLLATQGIRGGANRQVLERIKQTGDIFMTWSDRPWVLNGAAVRVSMVGFDNGSQTLRYAEGKIVSSINADLSSSIDVTKAPQLLENKGICFLGMMKAGPFDLQDSLAQSMLKAPTNPNGRPNSDVVKLRLGGQDVVRRPRPIWIIDFGVDTTEQEAAFYEAPFEYVRTYVKPKRDVNRRDSMRKKWWLFGEPRRGLRTALKNLKRCIVTPEVSKYRIFDWMPTTTIPDHKLHVFARDDDYFFGVLHSKVHEVWSLAQCSWLGVGNDPSYSSSRTFETFPFPWLPYQEPLEEEDEQVAAIARAARDLVKYRDNWLNPPDVSVDSELKKRTLTNLYNLRPTWLDQLHQKLDKAVLEAYGWPQDLNDEVILEKLVELNLERANQSGKGVTESALSVDDQLEQESEQELE